jgi:hypothetical protein
LKELKKDELINPAFELKVKDAEFGSSVEQQERMKTVDLPTQTG